MYRLSKKSLDILKSCDSDLQTVFKAAILYSPFYFEITRGSKEAVYVTVYDEGMAAGGRDLHKIVVRHILKIAKNLYENAELNRTPRWETLGTKPSIEEGFLITMEN